MSVTLSTASPPSEKDIHLFQEAQKGNREARNELVETHFGLVVFWANKHKQAINTIPLEDLIQEGSIGLIKAVEMFDWKRGNSFSTYASWWIKQHMQRAIHQARVIRIPAFYGDSILPPIVISLNISVGEDGAGALMDLIVDESVHIEQEVCRSHLRGEIREAIAPLPPKVQFLLIEEFGLFGRVSRPLKEICQEIGIATEHAHQIRRKALRKLRSFARRCGMDAYL